MSDVTDDTLAEMDQLVAEGVPDFKLFTAYPGVFYSDDAAIFRAMQQTAQERRADHDARGERAGHRHRRGPARRRGQDRPLLPRRRALPDLRGRGDEPGDPAGRGGGRARVHRPPVGDRRPRRRPRRPRPGRPGVRRDLPAVPVPEPRRPGQRVRGLQVRVLAAAAARRTRTGSELWTGLRKDDLQVVSTDHCPFDFHGQKELGRGDFRKIPNGLPGVEDRVDLLHDGGVVGGPDLARALGRRSISTEPAKLFGMYPRKGASPSARTRTSSSTTRTARGRSRAAIAPHGRRLLVLRGPAGPGRLGRRPQPRLGRRAATASSRARRATAGS